jgi:hypothetical protein
LPAAAPIQLNKRRLKLIELELLRRFDIAISWGGHLAVGAALDDTRTLHPRPVTRARAKPGAS